jgi:LuxR family maltose regulon positive regulatory protein
MPFTDLILNTKLYIPPKRLTLVARPSVIERLEKGLNRSIILVSAPAGFGKTTLLSEWHTSENGKTQPLAWLSLDPEDNDIERFLLYLATALDTLKKGISDSILPLLQTNQLPAIKVILTSLINELDETLQLPFILVLDDYHLITSPVVHEALIFLVENIPPQMRLVILTREDPPLPLARLRARQQLTEIRAADLRFSIDESAAFFNQVMGLNLTASDIETLETRTEGWIAGLQMIAISISGRDDKSDFIRSFASSHRFIFDYLIEEVLEGLAPEIKDFLVRTSILDRMCAPLCDAVTGKNSSQNILLQLEQMNLFIIPLDDQRRWYRYHHLFADILHQQLRTANSGNNQDLHQKAYKWYQDNDLIGDAIHHALAIGDYETVADLSEKLVFESIERHELFTIANWLENLPDEIMQAKPWLNVAFAWILFRTRQFDRVEQHLQNMEHSLPELQEDNAHIQSHIAAIQAYLAGTHGDIEKIAFMARKSLGLLPEKEKRLRGSMFSLLGSSLQLIGNFKEAKQAYFDGIAASKAAGDWQNTIESYGDLTGFYVERGQLHEGFSACQEALKYAESSFKKAGRNPVETAYIHFRLSTILRHWNELEESLWHAKKAIEITQKWGSGFRLAYVNLGIALQAIGQHEEAMQAIQQAETMASEESEFWLAEVRSVRVLLRLDQGNLDAASSWALESGLSPDDEIPFSHRRQYLSLAQVLLARGQGGDLEALNQTIQLLSRFQDLVDASNASAYSLQVLILKALAYQVQGNMEAATSAIGQALSIAEQGGYIRVFVREGSEMKKLLEQAVRIGVSPIYAGKLLEAFGDDFQEVYPTRRKDALPDILAETLTSRELEVLRLLDTELPIPNIANELVVSVETVRTHIKRIYRKLDVHSRYEAVVRAKDLNLF